MALKWTFLQNLICRTSPVTQASHASFLEEISLSPQTPEVLEAHPEKRSAVAQEIVASEVAYLRSLEIMRDWYMTPLRRALQSNKAILAAHHIHTLFGDAMVLLEVSR